MIANLKGPRLSRLGDLVSAAREEAGKARHSDELIVLLIYTKADPPPEQMAEELGMPRSECAALLRAAAERLKSDPGFNNHFHRLNRNLRDI